jgi:hypothetical protein
MKYFARKWVLFTIFEVITVVLLKIQPLCDIMPYRVVNSGSQTSVSLYQSTRLTVQKTLILRFHLIALWYTGRLIMFSVITNIYNEKTKGSTLMV